MSNNNFFAVGRQLFNKSQVKSVTEKTVTKTKEIEVQERFAIVSFIDGTKPVEMRLADGQKLEDLVRLSDLNDETPKQNKTNLEIDDKAGQV